MKNFQEYGNCFVSGGELSGEQPILVCGKSRLLNSDLSGIKFVGLDYAVIDIGDASLLRNATSLVLRVGNDQNMNRDHPMKLSLDRRRATLDGPTSVDYLLYDIVQCEELTIFAKSRRFIFATYRKIGTIDLEGSFQAVLDFGCRLMLLPEKVADLKEKTFPGIFLTDTLRAGRVLAGEEAAALLGGYVDQLSQLSGGMNGFLNSSADDRLRLVESAEALLGLGDRLKWLLGNAESLERALERWFGFPRTFPDDRLRLAESAEALLGFGDQLNQLLGEMESFDLEGSLTGRRYFEDRLKHLKVELIATMILRELENEDD